LAIDDIVFLVGLPIGEEYAKLQGDVMIVVGYQYRLGRGLPPAPVGRDEYRRKILGTRDLTGSTVGPVSADAWQTASTPEKENELLVAEAMFGILGGTFRSFIAWLYGLPFLLLGLAVALSEVYPRWLGCVDVVAGAGAVVAGTTLFLNVPLVPFPLLFGGFVIPLNFWLAVIGLLMWRRAALPPRHPANKR